MPGQKSTATKIPKDGWVQELGDAESAANRSRSAGAQLRLAIAAYKLRDFKKLKTAANLGLALDPSEGEKELLKEYVDKSKGQNEIMTLGRNTLQQMREPYAKCETLVIHSSDGDVPFTNLYILQHAVVNGNVTLMEEVVAFGAALDRPVWEEDAPGIPPLRAPPGSTALLLACALLAMHGEIERCNQNLRRNVPTLGAIDQVCECAIRLVHLGANCQVKLQIPAQSRNASVHPKDPVDAFRLLDFGGKTAQELAGISRRQELIRDIELMQKEENLHLTQCRCGSRLPWYQCHGAPIPGQSNLCIRADDGILRWRLSPKAACPCKLTNKEHYKCCWFTSTPFYKDDTGGDLVKVLKIRKSALRQTLFRLQHMRISEIMDPNDPTITQGTLDEYRTTQTDLIRSKGLTMFSDFNGRRWGVENWDPMVYAGVVDRIDDFFMWTDLHWRLTKVELLHRTKLWNEALEKYCDDIGLTGAEREAVFQKHTANPCAPCANPPCENWEKEPKEYKTCSRCKSIAYCSIKCQKRDWKAQHKAECVAT
jgi:hypothetical protein